MTRGILYVVWNGDHGTQNLLSRSVESVRAVHPELPIHVEQLPDFACLLDKARLADFSPFSETLFLDSDTVVLDRLDYGFEKAREFGLACCINECPWARRYDGLKDRGDIRELNTGVLFFTRESAPVFDAWKIQVDTIDSRLIHMRTNERYVMPCNDQAAFASAVESMHWNPFILPLNWNFRPRWHQGPFGPVKIWHDVSPVPDDLLDWNTQQTATDCVIDFRRVA